jgi:hypothetical protein
VQKPSKLQSYCDPELNLLPLPDFLGVLMNREMCWLSISDQDEKVLYLRVYPHQPWQPYTDFPLYVVPDHQVPGGSKGWATYQKLLRTGWKLVPTAVAEAQMVMLQRRIA